jgi:hypothetical protein
MIISRWVTRVNGTIDFNDEFRPAADEIDDVAANLNLARK